MKATAAKTMTPTIVETVGLGRRFGAHWALSDCTLAIPEGCLTALVGPNGAGKSTLLNLIVGLTTPTAGQISVLGGVPAGSPAALDGIGFVAQDTPLYRSLSVADMVHMTCNLNRGFDTGLVRRRLNDLGIDGRMRVGRLSGGQRAQFALTLAMARHPRLLVLDEPTASLDPLARHSFMATVLAAMADDGMSVVLSSHLLAELERFTDHLVLIAYGRVRCVGPVEQLLGEHRMITSPTSVPLPPEWDVVEAHPVGTSTRRLVRLPGVDEPRLPAGAETVPIGLEELAMAYLRESRPTPRIPVGARP